MKKHLELVSGTDLRTRSGQPTVSLRWVFLRDLAGRQEAQALPGTDRDLAFRTILTEYLRRWRMEAAFQEVRTHLGDQTQRQWSDLAIARPPTSLL